MSTQSKPAKRSAKNYLTNVDDIDRAIEAFHNSESTAGSGTRIIVRHSKEPSLVAPLKAVLWAKGHLHPSFAEAADGGTAHVRILGAGYVEEFLDEDVFEAEPDLKKALSKIGVRKAPTALTVFRYVHGDMLATALAQYFAAEQHLRNVLGRPGSRTDVLRGAGEFLYCRLFGGVQCPIQNTYGFDVTHAKAPKRVQVKLARKAHGNSAGVEIQLRHLADESFDRLSLFWLTPENKVEKYIELTLAELQAIAVLRKGQNKFDLQLRHIAPEIQQRSRRRFQQACKSKGMSFLDATHELAQT